MAVAPRRQPARSNLVSVNICHLELDAIWKVHGV